MRAIINTVYGPPSVARLMEIPKPVPGDAEVCIKVYASTVNRTDCGFRSAQYFISRFFSGLIRPKNKTLGNEFAGKIDSVGNSVKEFSIGDRVFGYNDSKFGAHAEFMIMPADGTMDIIPDSYSYEQAAPLTEGSHYALGNIRAAKVKAGDNVLVNGATGAIGSAAVQLLKYFGARVTAVCNTKNTDLVLSLGADKVVDYSTQDFTNTEERYHFIFDAVGKSSFGKCKPLLHDKGIYISTELGKNSENIFLALTTAVWGRKKLLFPIPSITKADIRFIKDLAEKGIFRPVIDRTYLLEEIQAAYTYVETGQKTGNVILKIGEQQFPQISAD